MQSFDTPCSPADLAVSNTQRAPELPPVTHSQGSETAGKAEDSLEYWYFCDDDAAMRLP